MGAQASQPMGTAPGTALHTTTMQGPAGPVQSGSHTPLPVDTTPYLGPKLEYLLINVTARMDMQGGFFSRPIMTTNVDSYYPALIQNYPQGFKMIQFQTIPGVKQQAGWMSQAVPFQAILMRPVGIPPPAESWNLQIVKSAIELQTFYSFSWYSTQGQMANTNDVMNKIMEMTQKGARLICIEPTGAVQGPSFSSGLGGHAGTIGVDLLFHIPQHPNPTPYIYHGLHVAITYGVQAGFGMPRYQCLTDIGAQFAAFLQQGWKLVEINPDQSSLRQATGFASGQVTMNSMWFFEKEAAFVNDPTPRWQGTIVTYQHKVKGSFGGVVASRHTWDPVMVEMGQRGWELACILETPEVIQASLTSSTITVLLFFQRPIYRQV
ncbi:uncharacterized protein [Diadema antillarum]|uniref:uncharacterized protein n=1 Tax=Diadema antillarum TaxID=105358 RepID=UPI003A8602F6